MKDNKLKLEDEIKVYLRRCKQIYSGFSYFSKLFLKPMEITLKKTYLQNSNQASDAEAISNRILQPSEPSKIKEIADFGLCEVKRLSSFSDKRTLEIIRHPDFGAQLDYLETLEEQLLTCPEDQKRKLADKKRAILKSKSLLQMYSARKQGGQKKRIKVAICVCVYSEEEEMFKRTLSGINANYQSFMDDGVSPQQIAVVFVFDGIEKVSKGIATFMDNMDTENNFKWKKYGKKLVDVLAQQQQYSKNRQSQNTYDPQNLNIYEEEQVKEIDGRLFHSQAGEYVRRKQQLALIRKLIGQNGLTYSQLPRRVQLEYVRTLRKQREAMFLMQGEQCTKLNETELLDFFKAPSYEGLREKSAVFALTEVESYLNRYFQSRQDTALLYSYRYEVDYKLPHPVVAEEDSALTKLDSYLFMCVKHTNGGKLSSQKWFFQGFCAQFQCETAILLDVGLKPDTDALFKFYKHLTLNKNCGGVCGYMGLAIERPYNQLGYYHQQRRLDGLTKLSQSIFDIQKAQRFQYHFAHMLDKPFESFFGFINVLPGAFSGYNMDKLFSNNKILDDYFASLNSDNQKINFKVDSFGSLLLSIFLPRAWVERLYGYTSEQIPKEDLSAEQSSIGLSIVSPERINFGLDATFVQQSKQAKMKTPYEAMKYKNVCLAEDRILCLGIHQKSMTMAFLPDAWATVDSVTSLQNLMAQRRRWNNGSYFAFEQVTIRSQMGCKDIGFTVEMLFNLFSSAMAYISIALFYVTLDMTASTFAKQVLKPLFYQFYDVSSDQELGKCAFLFADAKKVVESIPEIVSFFYVVMVGGMVFFSLSLNQTNIYFQRIYNKICSLLGWYSILMYVMLCVNIFGPEKILSVSDEQSLVSSSTLKLLVEVILATQAIPPIFFFLFVKRDFKYLWEIMTSAPSYIFYGASYLHVLNIYAVCRVDDLSWGTKGLTSGNDGEKTKLKQAWQTQKYIFVCRFLSWNVMIAIALKLLVGVPLYKSVVILVLSGAVGFSLVFRLIFAILYLIGYKVSSWWRGDTKKNHWPSQYFTKTYQEFEQYLIEDTLQRKKELIENYMSLAFGILGEGIGVKKASIKKLVNNIRSDLVRLDSLAVKGADLNRDSDSQRTSNAYLESKKAFVFNEDSIVEPIKPQPLSKKVSIFARQKSRKETTTIEKTKRLMRVKLPPIDAIANELQPRQPNIFKELSTIVQSSVNASHLPEESVIEH